MPILSRGTGGRLVPPLPARGGKGFIVLGRPRGGGGGPAPPVDPLLLSLSESGEPQLTGDVTFSAGAGITLTQVGQDIEIAVT